MNDTQNLTLNAPPATANFEPQKNYDLHRPTPDILRIFNGGDSYLTPTSNAILEMKMNSKSVLYSGSFKPVEDYNVDSNQSDSSPSEFPAKNNNCSAVSVGSTTSNNDTSYQQYSSAPLPLVDLIMTVDESEEMDTLPSIDFSLRLPPIDMQSQEEAKLELKRRKNREAATRYRKRKLEIISKLEETVKVLREENQRLSQMLFKLKREYDLQQNLFKHRQCGSLLPATIS